jgi:predicted NAD-dependent protein-ADP-ribosyltransferase YbiA (DUF1768 family)
MDIGSKNGYPSSALSNFAPHPFVIDGVKCNSMEGFLQSLKFSNMEMQEHICTLVGFNAKQSGKGKNWQRTQTLYWRDKTYDRHSQEYQDLLDRVYNALAENDGFKKALLATQDAVLTHSIGRTDNSETILTRQEFCSRLTRIRERLQNESNS